MKFDKYGGKVSFTVADEKLEFKRIKTERLQSLINYSKDENTVLINVVDFFVDEMKKNYPDESEDGILGFVQNNAMNMFEEMQIAYGLLSREELEKAKKKAMEKLELEDDAKQTTE